MSDILERIKQCANCGSTEPNWLGYMFALRCSHCDYFEPFSPGSMIPLLDGTEMSVEEYYSHYKYPNKKE